MKRFRSKLKSFFQFFKVDYSFVCLLILMCLLDMLKFYVLYIIFILLHELSHLLVAKHLGYLPKRLKLTVFGAALEGFDDFLVLDEIKIVFAGPLFNLVIVVLCYLCFWFQPESYEYLYDVLIVNQTILLFNVLPIFPLDFGRVLLSLCSIKNGRREAVKIIRKVSFFFMIVLFICSIFIFLFSLNLSLGLACVNLCILLFESTSGTSFKREIVLRKKLKRLNRGVAQRIIYVNANLDEKFLLKFIDGDYYYVFVFVDESFRELKRIEEFELLKNLGFI